MKLAAKKIVAVLLFLMPLCAQQHQKDFIKSFVMHYDFSPEGRYTHEYHPFLLDQTRASMADLESCLIEQGFDVQGRIMIMGYQQEGVPSYYSNMNAHVIDDEISLKTKKGRVVPAHNIFGFLTGFLLKDCNWLQKKWFPEQPLVVEHIQSERVDLFDDGAYLFQKHAFGENFDGILGGRNVIEKSLKQRNLSGTLQRLIAFWERVYKGELKSSGQEVLATQDILFSVDYAKHLTQTKVPLTKMYVGPDITYPIEILPFQEQGVTESAQYFVKHFTPTLQPRDGKKTAYIFCSFVDGVGKSTLLGNVINFAKHGEDVTRYERVDNSSSQRGTLYNLRENAYIMDLPAQLSHWVSKPDGFVFVDIQSVKEIDQNVQQTLHAHVKQNADQYIDAFDELLDSQKFSESNYDVYAKNVMLFEPEERWIPFEHNDCLYLFNEHNTSRIKMLVPLEGVHSRGLKTVQPEQMLFSKGLLLPMRYDDFMKDIVRQFKEAGIEKLVFVDFLSMYPRSSRENVRINFLMQQLKTLFPKSFSVDKSLYRSFINHGPELYHLISESQSDLSNALYLETMVRTALYNLFKERSASDIVLLSEKEVSRAIEKEIEIVQKQNGAFLQDITNKKVEEEFGALKRYEHDKNYEVFVKFSFQPLVAFSSFMEELFVYDFANDYLCDLWTNIRMPSSTKVVHTFNADCRDGVSLTPLFLSLRAQWYAMLSHLVYAEQRDDGAFSLEKVADFVVPVLVDRDGKSIKVKQKALLPPEEFPKRKPITLRRFHNYVYNKDLEWGLFNSIPHCLQWGSSETHWGIYAFGCGYSKYSFLRRQLTAYQQDASYKGWENVAMSSSMLLDRINQHNKWTELAKPLAKDDPEVIEPDSPRIEPLRLWVRAIATLEMIVKDPQVFIMTRKNNKKDFIATLQLLERVTLPRYFNIEFKKPLFKDYSKVDPVISWDAVGA